MSEKNLNKFINALGLLSTFAIFIGALLKLQRTEWGGRLYIYGLLAWFVISSIEISRLKKQVKKLEERKFGESIDILSETR